MTTKNAVIFIIIVALVILVIFIFFPRQKPSQNQPLTVTESTEITPPPATGNVDDLVDATIKEIEDENLSLKDEEKDISIITSDQQEISDFGQTINATEF
jgi:hypothetical protein